MRGLVGGSERLGRVAAPAPRRRRRGGPTRGSRGRFSCRTSVSVVGVQVRARGTVRALGIASRTTSLGSSYALKRTCGGTACKALRSAVPRDSDPEERVSVRGVGLAIADVARTLEARVRPSCRPVSRGEVGVVRLKSSSNGDKIQDIDHIESSAQ